ncbi:MAG: oxidoreductase [Candidatus Andersenbacteria bacterium]|nr:oxidoreductase [Candidatus Andersenbacteria bacterium]
MRGIIVLLGGITMYRLMLYFLICLLAAAVVLSGFGALSYSAGTIALQTIFLVVLCWAVNRLLARAVSVPTNTESAIITGLILSAIAGPFSVSRGWLVWAVMAAAAMASKYVLVWRRRHIFNPAAAGALAAALLFGQPASWWIGTGVLLPVVLVGWLVVQKIRRWHLVASFLGVYVGLILLNALGLQDRTLPEAGRWLYTLFAATPLLFFSVVMLIEPLTAPRTVPWRIAFGSLVAGLFFFLPRLFDEMPYGLELALLAGNGAGWLINHGWRQKFVLSRKEIFSTYGSFWFRPAWRFSFAPGQFLEYTLPHAKPDARGVRRYFTVASSPTEEQVLLTTKLTERSSSFKRELSSLAVGETIVAADNAGEFTLPRNLQQKMAWLAGGIGVTPFRSMTKFLLDTKQARDIVLLYAAREEEDLAFRDTFEQAHRQLGMRVFYVLSEAAAIPPGSQWRRGVIGESLLRQAVPDFAERLFYLSGPEPMVHSMADILRGMGVPRRRIKRDYFPGYGV